MCRSVLVLSVAFAVTFVVTVVTVGRRGEGHLSIVPGEVGENTILNIASEESLLAHGVSVLSRVDSPAHISAEELGTFFADLDVLVQIKLE
jgi:nickel-dependent lactate racemase